MAIKKPVTKLQSKSTPPPTPASKFKKRAREVEEEEPDAEAEGEEEEESPAERKLRLKLAALKAAKKKKADPEEDPEDEGEVDADNEADVQEEEPAEEEEEAPAPRKGSKLKKKAGKKTSLADVFDSTKPGRGLMPAGDFRAIVKGYELDGEIADDPDEQGALKVKVTYEGHEDEEEGVAGKTISQWYQIADDDGQPGPGIPFLKGDLDILGYEDVLLADLQEIFDDVEAEQPQVIIKVKQNGQYTNAYLQGLADEA